MFRTMKESDKNFIQQKESLIESLKDIADFLGDEDAKKVSLTNSETPVQLDAASANSETENAEHQEDFVESAQ